MDAELLAAVVAAMAVVAGGAEDAEDGGGGAHCEPEDYGQFEWKLEDQSDRWIESHLR